MKKLLHIPTHPLHECTQLEKLYLQIWQTYADQNPADWRKIFTATSLSKINQRTATVAASFIVYMATNAGREFTDRAESLWANGVFASKADAFIAAWAIANGRHLNTNHGLRSIEFALANEHPIRHDVFNGEGADWDRVPAVTMDDHDTFESMVLWWSSAAANDLRQQANVLDSAAQRSRV